MKIEAYQYRTKTIDPAVAEKLPFKKLPEFFEDVLDAITAACEQGAFSAPNWTPIPRQTGHPVQRKLDTDSAPNWTV